MALTYVPPEDENIRLGGQSTSKLLTGTLEDAKRRARLTGRNLSQAEIEGLTSSHFGAAGNRLAARHGLSLTKRGQDINAELGYAGLASKEEMFGRGLTSHEALAREQLATDFQIAQMTAGEQRRATESSGGLFGGGGFLGLGCIIISACTSRSSWQVELAREYRDCVLDETTLGGYYALSHVVAPLIFKYKLVKWVLKRFLVDRMADRFEWYFGLRKTHKFCTSRFVTHKFLSFCKFIGKHVNAKAYIELHA